MHIIYQKLDNFIHDKKAKTLLISEQELIELKEEQYLYHIFIKDLKLNKIKFKETNELILKKTFLTKKKRIKEIDLIISSCPELNNIISVPLKSNILFNGCLPFFYQSLKIWNHVGLILLETIAVHKKTENFPFDKEFLIDRPSIEIPLVNIDFGDSLIKIDSLNPDIIFSNILNLQNINRTGTKKAKKANLS